MLDVMFLVMVFFIYCIFDMALHKGVEVELPSAEGSTERGERIVITIRADDSMQLNGIDLDRDEVVSRVKALRAAQVDFPVIISGDRGSSLGTGMELLSELKKTGVEKVSFQVSGKKR